MTPAFSKSEQLHRKEKIVLGKTRQLGFSAIKQAQKRKPIKKVSKKQGAELVKRAKLKKELIEESGGLCMKCGNLPDKKDGWGKLHLIHKISLAQGGKTNRKNCYVGCRTCHNPEHGIIEK